MAVDEIFNRPWTRKHDNPSAPLLPSVPVTAFPKSLEELIELCVRRNPGDRAKAAGSHWALSDAAIADNTFVETHDPKNVHQAMGKTLFEVVPGCLNPAFVAALANLNPAPYDSEHSAENTDLYPVHFQTGKRIFQLYAELDLGDATNPQSLAVLLQTKHGNSSYLGPWALPTMGGAGGQTAFGALTTGTHGADFHFPPIADAVMAMHLVVDGGRHYWIEPSSPTALGVPLTTDPPLKRLYGQNQFRGGQSSGLQNFTIIRDDDIFNSVVVGVGRFGIVYSVVISAVRQYSLHQQRRLTTWEAVKGQVNDPASALYSNRFLQIAVCATPSHNFTSHLAGVTKNWNVPLLLEPATNEPAGRSERRGPVIVPFDPLIQAPRFQFAGNSHGYAPNPAQPGASLSPSFLDQACTDTNLLQGVLTEVAQDLKQFVDSNGTVIGAAIAGVVAAGAGGALLALLAILALLLPVLLALLATFAASPGTRLGQALNDIRNKLLNPSQSPAERAAGLFIWQMIATQLFSSEQGDLDFEAISYAVMDGFDYLDQSCEVNVVSVEVFFDATDPMLIAFVDALLVFEIGQETTGKAFAGYISLRFVGPTRALLGMEQHPLTCSVEISGLKDVAGTQEMIDFATTLALNPNFNAILHWGQHNPSTQSEVEQRFGDTPANPVGNLHKWRQALSQLTENGKLDGFSSLFTRTAGLEVVTPQIAAFTLTGGSPLSQPIVVTWDCGANPQATTVTLNISPPNAAASSYANLPLAGQQDVVASGAGTYKADLTASLAVGGEVRTATAYASVAVA